jgi:hypothetical protein
MSNSLYARDSITTGYKEVHATETSPGVWALNTVGGAAGSTPASSSAVTSVTASATSVQLVPVNTLRRGVTIHNDSTSKLRLKLGITASAGSFTVYMAADSYYETPWGYTGRIDGIWDSAVGSARISELT